MPRYDRWENNDYKLTKRLKETELFHRKLLPDIRKGIVFPAFRKGKVDFYYRARKLFSFDGNEFKSNIAHLAAFHERPKGEVKESRFVQLEPAHSFLEGYSQIKSNIGESCGEPESSQVACVWKDFSFWSTETNEISVFDTEIVFAERDRDSKRKSDRIDLVLHNRKTAEILFLEVKRYSDNRLSRGKEGIPKIVNQMKRYRLQISSRLEEIVADYSQMIRLMNLLLNAEHPEPKKVLGDRAHLLICEFNADQEANLKENLQAVFNNDFAVLSRGSLCGMKQGTLKKWWREVVSFLAENP